MERAKKSRTIIRRAFTKLYDKLVAELKNKDLDKIEIQTNMSMIENRANELEELDKAILNIMIDTDVDIADCELEYAAIEEYQRKYKKIQIEVSNVLNPVVVQTVQVDKNDTSFAHSVHLDQSSRRKFKLPEIELKKFDGNIKNWLHFWGQFQKIHEDKDLAAEDKFQYLIEATVSGSRAREFVNSFPPNADSYMKAVEGLKIRFGREDMLIEVYVRELLSLVLKKVVNKSELLSLVALYDKLECYLRALESLGVTSEKYAAMLFPLVESCLPEDLLRVWQRSSTIEEDVPENIEDTERRSKSFHTITNDKRLKKLMLFIRSEVQNEERISLATTGFNLTEGIEQKDRKKKIQNTKEKDVPTATTLVNVKEDRSSSNNCVFCGKKHNSAECFRAKRMSLEEKRKIVNDKKCCFYCLKTNHFAKKCRVFLKCMICEGRHVILMCPQLSLNQDSNTVSADRKNVTATNSSVNPEVFLQTLVVKIKYGNETCIVRAMIDTGSQRSYVLQDTAKKMKLSSKGRKQLIHSLFGGVETMQQEHKLFKICVCSLDDKYSFEFDVLSQEIIVNEVSHIKDGIWMKELQMSGIELTDIGKIKGPIQLLLGADVAGKLFTNRQQLLSCGLVALETRLGWTLIGKVPEEMRSHCTATTIISTFVQDAKICNLWELDILGIRDPIETKSKHEKDFEVQQRFMQTVRTDDKGRYEIKLPWVNQQPEIPSNYEAAERRLHWLTRKLKAENNFESYDQVFKEWCNEGIIEEVATLERNQGHFLPHRHVIKENSTTRIRPVFNASSKTKMNVSLNECLEIGPNMIELIPAILLRFRRNKIGVIADIRRAFLQISISNDDRDFLKFLWWDEQFNIKVYRHARVVFGISSSPFLLAAVINYHLNKTLINLDRIKNDSESTISKETVKKLLNSFYVDNCVTSLHNEEELDQFIQESKIIMSNACFDLRGWEYTSDNNTNDTAMVLGLRWHKHTDTLEINVNSLNPLENQRITKRLILSVCQKLFDPIGFTCPITIYPKLLLQQAWKNGTQWDAEVDEEMKTKFLNWYNELNTLVQIKIPRWLTGTQTQEPNVSVSALIG